jgi:hypothetical protein
MSLEHHDADAGRGGLAARSDPGAPGLGESWGWLLVQRDWGLRQREPRGSGVGAELRRRVAAAAAWLRRLVCGAPRGAVQDTAR